MSFSKMTLKELALYLEERGRLSPAEEAQLQADRRRGAGLLLERYRKRQERERLEEARLQKMLRQERFFWRQGIKYIAGVDEAGRGPLAGPVVAAAVILPPETTIRYLDDSKKLTAARREVLYDEIKAVALGSAVGICSPAEIDRLNIYEATMRAMRGALSALPLEPRGGAGGRLFDSWPEIAAESDPGRGRSLPFYCCRLGSGQSNPGPDHA